MFSIQSEEGDSIKEIVTKHFLFSICFTGISTFPQVLLPKEEHTKVEYNLDSHYSFIPPKWVFWGDGGISGGGRESGKRRTSKYYSLTFIILKILFKIKNTTFLFYYSLVDCHNSIFSTISLILWIAKVTEHKYKPYLGWPLEG